MNLCIDQGNSRTKVALFDGEQLRKKIIYKTFAASEVEKLFTLYPIENAIISSVINIDAAIVNALHRHSKKFVLFDYHTPIPINNCYSTPETLGLDRLSAAIGAHVLCPQKVCVLIDVGTAVTIDFLSEKGEYIGGNIAPGIKMRLTALHTDTKKLPLVSVEPDELLPLFGRSTRDAIASGVIRGLAYEIKGYLRSLSEQMDTFQTFLTGGHVPYILPYLESTPSIRVEKNLVLIGLNNVLQYA